MHNKEYRVYTKVISYREMTRLAKDYETTILLKAKATDNQRKTHFPSIRLQVEAAGASIHSLRPFI